MNSNEKVYLTKVKPELLSNIIWNTILIAHLQSTGILSKADINHLKSFQNLDDRIWEFIEIIQTRSDGYQKLIEALSAVNQTGAVAILKAIPSMSSTRHVVKKRWSLNFGDADIKTNVLQKVQLDLIDKMQNEGSNDRIIMTLKALGCFNPVDIVPIQNNPYRTQQKRMTELLELVQTLDRNWILKCLECMCNLKDMDILSQEIRLVFEEHYPGSVVE